MRVKRIEKEINRTIIEANQVPDFVLDKARREIQNSTPTIYVQNRCYKHKFKPITIAMACIAILLIVITSITIALNSDSRGVNDDMATGDGLKDPATSGKPINPVDPDAIFDPTKVTTCYYKDLIKKEYNSIEDIINEYHIRFYSLRNLEKIDSDLFFLDDQPVLLEENYYFKGKILHLKSGRDFYQIIFDEELTYSELVKHKKCPYYFAVKDDMVYLKIKDGLAQTYLIYEYYDNFEEIIDYFWENS